MSGAECCYFQGTGTGSIAGEARVSRDGMKREKDKDRE